jgi:8-oxo-dGTP pyrophosphatase MutT (NUDIX family)
MMTRNDLLIKLRCYAARWRDESDMTSRFVEFVESHEDCFERSLTEGHVTGSAWVMDCAGTHVLLTHHKKLNRWLQLGGHADGDADTLRVAKREVAEESGLSGVVTLHEDIFDVDIHRIPERNGEPAHDHYDVRYLMQAPEGQDVVISDESHNLGWVAIDALASFTTEVSMLRMANKWRMFKRAQDA